MKILLVKPRAELKTITSLNPLIFLEPLELGYVAAAVPDEHEVRILDLRREKKPNRAFVKTLDTFQPDLIGLTAYSHEIDQVPALVSVVGERLPEAVCVVGGHHATVLPDDFNKPGIHAIVRGEGCAPFTEIVNRAAAGNHDFTGIENVLVPGDHYDHKAAAKMPRYPDLSTLPEPRRDLYDTDAYSCIWPSLSHPHWKTIFPSVSLVRSSFGCSMECSFCVVPMLCDRKHMKRDPEAVAREIENTPAGHIYFCDDETFLDAKHAAAVAEAIAKRGIEKRYFAWARSTTVNRHPELFERWREIGLDAVFLGFEATTDDELRDISKHATVRDNERALESLRGMGIAVQAGFMVNAQFSESDFARLQDYIKNMPPTQVTCTVFTPSPGSPAWHEERTHYMTEDPFALHDCMHPLTPTQLPLKQFFREFGKVSSLGSSRNPLRGARFPLRDIIRIIRAATGYSRALKRAYKDYPRNVRRKGTG